MRRLRILVPLALLLVATHLSGCAGVVVGGAATAGVAAYQERGIKGVARDTTTATRACHAAQRLRSPSHKTL